MFGFCWQNNKIEKITAEHISHLHQLDTLNLQNNMLTTDGKHTRQYTKRGFVTVDCCVGLSSTPCRRRSFYCCLPDWIKNRSTCQSDTHEQQQRMLSCSLGASHVHLYQLVIFTASVLKVGVSRRPPAVHPGSHRCSQKVEVPSFPKQRASTN